MATASGAAASSSSTTSSSQTSNMAPDQKVDFDSCYEKGTVYVFPPIQQSRVKVFKETRTEVPQDPAVPLPPPKYAMEADQAKMDRNEANLKAEEVEDTVVKLLHDQLQQAASPGDSPSIIFPSLKLDNQEKDIVIFHEKYGVIVVEVKAVKKLPAFDRLQKAAEQLLKARAAVRTDLQGLLEPDAVTLLVALPNLTDPGDTRQRMQILRDNPDIQLLCGTKEDDYKDWLQQMTTRPAPWGGQVQPDSHQAFVQAVSQHLSVQRYSPSQTVLDHAGHHARWLVTPAQAPLLHCQVRLLHLWGPPGAGKTVFLLHSVRQWLAEGKAVLIAVGYPDHSVLLQQLGRSALTRQQDEVSSRVALCRDEDEFQKTVEQLGRRVSPADVCVVVDEVEGGGFLPPALAAFRSQQISRLWTASVTDLPDTQSAEFSSLGGQRVCLPQSLRCPPHVVEQAGRLVEAGPLTPPMDVFPYLPARLPTASLKVTLHPSHPHFLPPSPPHYRSRLLDSPSFDCGQCSQWLRSSLPPLVEGLPMEDERWRHWIILVTGWVGLDSGVAVKLVEWLRQQGVPAVWEKPDWDLLNLPVSSVQGGSGGQGSGDRGQDEQASRRERQVSGLDTQQRPAVHVIPAARYTGLEKPGVLVLHWDWRDEKPYEQSQAARDSRLSRHRDQLFSAVTRCQADLCVCLLSPSPAACLLPQLPGQEVEAAERRVLAAAADPVAAAFREEERRQEERRRGLAAAEEEQRLRREEELRRQLREGLRRQREEEQSRQGLDAAAAVRAEDKQREEEAREHEEETREHEEEARGSEEEELRRQQEEELIRLWEELRRQLEEEEKRQELAAAAEEEERLRRGEELRRQLREGLRRQREEEQSRQGLDAGAAVRAGDKQREEEAREHEQEAREHEEEARGSEEEELRRQQEEELIRLWKELRRQLEEEEKRQALAAAAALEEERLRREEEERQQSKEGDRQHNEKH